MSYTTTPKNLQLHIPAWLMGALLLAVLESSLWSTQRTHAPVGGPGVPSHQSPWQHLMLGSWALLVLILMLKSKLNKKDEFLIIRNLKTVRWSGLYKQSKHLRRTIGDRGSSLDTEGVWLRLPESRVSWATSFFLSPSAELGAMDKSGGAVGGEPSSPTFLSLSWGWKQYIRHRFIN